MSKKIMLLSLGSLAVATAVAVPVAVVLSGDSAKATTTGGAGTTPTPTTTGEAGKTGTTGDGAETPLKSTVPKLVSRHFDTAAEFNKHPFVTDVEIAKDGTEKDIVDQKGDFGRNEFIFAGGTKELAYLLGTSTLEDLNKVSFSFLEQMEKTIVKVINDNPNTEFTEAKKAIEANEKLKSAGTDTDDSAVVSVNLAKANGSTTADSIVININHTSWSDAKKILKAAKAYFENNNDAAIRTLKLQVVTDLRNKIITQTEYDQFFAKMAQKETTSILKGLFDRVVNSIS